MLQQSNNKNNRLNTETKNINSVTEHRSINCAWLPLHCAVMGRKHYRQNIPCQDAAFAANDPRPYIVACDGRGSAAKSHFGATEAVAAIRRQMTISHSLLSELLDPTDDSSATLLPILQDQFYRAAALVQLELAKQHNCKSKEFEFTLILMIVGLVKGFYLHIGDGALVIEKNGKTIVLSEAMNGDFANITNFVSYGTTAKMNMGLVDVADVTAIAAFSDGTAEKMIQAGTGKPTPGFAQIWKGMRQEQFGEKDLLNFLTNSDWEPKVQDDRSLSLLAKQTANSQTDVVTAKEESIHLTMAEQAVNNQTAVITEVETVHPAIHPTDQHKETGSTTVKVNNNWSIYSDDLFLAIILILQIIIYYRFT
jgi:Protein phosphatase 2C